jgi:hypothetical protein
MAANSKQGVYLTTSLAGLVALTAGLAGSHIVNALIGLVLLGYSAFGFYKIKGIET